VKRLLIDSHLDLAWNALFWDRDLTLSLDELNRRDAIHSDNMARGRATTSLPELRRGGVAVCLGTLMARVAYGKPGIFSSTLDYASHHAAYAAAQGQLAYYRRLAEVGEVALIGTTGELDAHWKKWQAAECSEWPELPVGIIVAMEGCDGIAEPAQATDWFQDGLRCTSLVHYGTSAYAHGTGEEGPLSDAGREVLKRFSETGMILDVTHLSDESFFEAIEVFDGPLMASHQNCRALIPGQRQFTDEQIQQVIQRDGILGSALDAWMLCKGWKRGPSLETTTSRDQVQLDAVADHMDHICQLAGNCSHVAIGSDLDGGFGTEQTPSGLESIADLQKLADILSRKGYDDGSIDAIFHGNWLRFFRQYLPEK